MRGKSVKLVRKFARTVWDSTPEDERKGFRNLNHFIKRVKTEWKSNNDFKKFVHYQVNMETAGIA